MTCTFRYSGRWYIYDTGSGAVIPSDEVAAYICEASELPLPPLCPADIRYDLARHAATEVTGAYDRILSLYREGLVFSASADKRLRTDGEFSADGELAAAALAAAGLSPADLTK